MARAFTKESDNESLEDPIPDPVEVLPPGVLNYITPDGAASLRHKLQRLAEKRPELLDRMGADPDASDRKALRDLDRRIRRLDARIAGLEVVTPLAAPPNRVVFGSTVTFHDPDGIEKTVRICGVDEADPDDGRISWISPLARALLGKAEGDEVTLDLPRGPTTLEIFGIGV